MFARLAVCFSIVLAGCGSTSDTPVDGESDASDDTYTSVDAQADTRTDAPTDSTTRTDVEPDSAADTSVSDSRTDTSVPDTETAIDATDTAVGDSDAADAETAVVDTSDAGDGADTSVAADVADTADAASVDAGVDTADAAGLCTGKADGTACTLTSGALALCKSGSCLPCITSTNDVACKTAYGGGTASYLCLAGVCAPGECRTDSNCTTVGKPGRICGLATPNVCGACTTDAQCKGAIGYGAATICSLLSGQCVLGACGVATTAGTTTSPNTMCSAANASDVCCGASGATPGACIAGNCCTTAQCTGSKICISHVCT